MLEKRHIIYVVGVCLRLQQSLSCRAELRVAHFVIGQKAYSAEMSIALAFIRIAQRLCELGNKSWFEGDTQHLEDA